VVDSKAEYLGHWKSKANSIYLGDLDPLMMAYNESIRFDRAFFAQDIAGSIAFARANIATGILTKDEFTTIEKGLNQVLDEWQTDKFEIMPSTDEDIHTANERRLAEIIGKDIAGKLHTYVL
jgi:argininosuccinate lyase